MFCPFGTAPCVVIGHVIKLVAPLRRYNVSISLCKCCDTAHLSQNRFRNRMLDRSEIQRIDYLGKEARNLLHLRTLRSDEGNADPNVPNLNWFCVDMASKESKGGCSTCTVRKATRLLPYTVVYTTLMNIQNRNIIRMTVLFKCTSSTPEKKRKFNHVLLFHTCGTFTFPTAAF